MNVLSFCWRLLRAGNKVESTGGGSDQDIEDLDIMIKRSVCATEAVRLERALSG